MDVSYSFRCDTQTQLAHVRRSSWPPGGKYQLWKTASELPLHRVRDRLAVTHLQPRSSRDRFRYMERLARNRTHTSLSPSLSSPCLSLLQDHQRKRQRKRRTFATRRQHRTPSTASHATNLRRALQQKRPRGVYNGSRRQRKEREC